MRHCGHNDCLRLWRVSCASEKPALNRFQIRVLTMNSDVQMFLMLIGWIAPALALSKRRRLALGTVAGILFAYAVLRLWFLWVIIGVVVMLYAVFHGTFKALVNSH